MNGYEITYAEERELGRIWDSLATIRPYLMDSVPHGQYILFCSSMMSFASLMEKVTKRLDKEPGK